MGPRRSAASRTQANGREVRASGTSAPEVVNTLTVNVFTIPGAERPAPSADQVVSIEASAWTRACTFALATDSSTLDGDGEIP